MIRSRDRSRQASSIARDPSVEPSSTAMTSSPRWSKVWRSIESMKSCRYGATSWTAETIENRGRGDGSGDPPSTVASCGGARHRVLGKPRSTVLVAGSGQREVTTLDRV